MLRRGLGGLKICCNVFPVVDVYLPKTKKFGCVGRGDLTSLFFSKVVKY